ncbi:unnamed protein product [Rotaria magnacalcarata]|uniref:[histone H3]-dimethyl-L-lysine(36) demethylase n=2 Tax=Rotaria magnacalcarata TaxID=392030 RepID=A0A814PNB7_9BILA|nr:unnamed protein product [Rotaria magnacalcarata]
MHSNAQGRRLRNRVKKNYVDDDNDDFFEEVFERPQRWQIADKLNAPDKYQGKFVEELTANEFNLSYVQRTGFPNPIVIKQHRGLGLRVPTSKFTVHDVRTCVGSQRLIDVVHVDTQQSSQMTMKSWTDYYDQPSEKRTRLLNVISLEFSHTKLERYVESPSIVREIDWVSNAWPQDWQDIQAEYQHNLKQEHMYYPKTRKYALMSVAKCFTDFHIDMGGSSVWYHLLKGKKVFWLIPPTESYLRLYEEWILSRQQNECFFADLCASNDCQMVVLEPDWTFFLPSGWIHAVYTVEDSLVFGGNFLNSFKIPMQIQVWMIERKVRIPDRFRYPYFIETMWYVIERYVQCLTGVTHILDDCLEYAQKQQETDGTNPATPIDSSDLKPCQTSRLLLVNNNNNNNNKDIEQQHQHLTRFELDGLQTLCSLLRKLKEKSVPEDLIQPQQLLETMERLLIDHASDDSQLSITGQPIIHYNYNHQYSFDTTNNQNETKTFQGIKRKNSDTNNMQQSSYHHLHPSHQYDALSMQQPTTNVVTLRPSTTVLLSGPLASSDSSNYYSPPPPPPPPQQQHYINNYNQYTPTRSPTQQHYPVDKNSTAKDRHKRVRCKQCEPCCRDDCSECVHCKDMPKFGGVGKMKQCCLTKQCVAPILPSTATCQVCLKKKGSRKLSQLKPEEVLYECERCMEINHLPCFHSAHSDASASEGVFSDDIPETWLCPKCITANTPEPPLYKLRPIVRRTLVTNNKGKNGLIELPYSDPLQQQHHILQQQQQQQLQQQQQQQQQQHHYHMYGANMNTNLNYTDPYEIMESEAKKRRLYASMYTANGNIDTPGIATHPSSTMNNNLVPLDDISQSLNDSDLYIPQMFAV